VFQFHSQTPGLSFIKTLYLMNLIWFFAFQRDAFLNHPACWLKCQFDCQKHHSPSILFIAEDLSGMNIF